MAQISAAAGSLMAMALMARSGIQPELLFQLLIQLLAWAILRFSLRYLHAEAGQQRYLKAMAWMLLGATLVVSSQDWPSLLAGWLITSRALQVLLTFYPGRQQAIMAASREAVASRLAVLCLCTGALLISWAVQSFYFYAAAQALDEPLRQFARQLGALLLVCCILLKTAQLPFHGWLTQVMEAPTPVSALLHAGVVNLGGMVLIKLEALWKVVPLSGGLLVLWGGCTAGLACWVMQTRISIKLRLAWSTCAQMGFMLMECGLGQYSLALLHLIAHSIYKAHAFLSSGSQLHATIRQPAPAVVHTAWQHLAQGLIGIGLLIASRIAWAGLLGHAVQAPWLLVVVIGLGLAPLCQRLRGCLLALLLCQLYLALHCLFSRLQTDHAGSTLLCQIPMILFFSTLYLLQGWLARNPGHVISQRLYAWAFGGLYLDEWWLRNSMRPARFQPQGGEQA